MVRDPEVHTLRGIQCIIWVHQHPQVAGTQAARNVLGAAVVIDSLDLLPAALDAVEEVVVAACKYVITSVCELTVKLLQARRMELSPV